ncbi:MAG TPA: hypothetical protein VF659_02555 [Pyrinomonadaceae bacterium]|jgi:hypothetical protein
MKTGILRLTFALSLLPPALAAPQKPPARGAAQGGTVVLAVSKYEANVSVEPAFIYSGGAFVKPPIQATAEEVGRFVREYLRPGRKYRLLSGGGEAGAVTVTKFEGEGCSALVATATAETQARLGGRVKALATDSQALGRGPSSRRAPTEVERAGAVELARAAYAKNGAPSALVGAMQVVNLTATDLDRDGKFELVGSFLVEKKVAGSAQDAYTLFLIIEPQGDSFKTAWEWFHHGFEGEYADRHFVDQMDLDGDGVGEVVVEGTYYESNDYVVYKRAQGRWRPVYQGGGGGC